jgi:soluble lytic murein transglycosylase
LTQRIGAALGGIALLAVAAVGFARRSGQTGGPCTPPPLPGPDSLIATGRYWHAWRELPPLRGGGSVAAERVLPHALVAEGLGQSERVEELLRRARGGDTVPALVALAARADERAGRWRAAELRYRRLLALAAAGPGERAAAAVRLALVLERIGERESALVAWRRAAQAMPEVADWFAIRRAALEPDTAAAFAALTGMVSPGAGQRSRLLVAARRMSAGNAAGALEDYRAAGSPLDVARVEVALGRPAPARLRAEAVLFRDPASPDALLAATFLSENFRPLTLAENLAASRAFRARDDDVTAERFARAAVQQSDTGVQAWLELSRIETARGHLAASLRALDSAESRAGAQRGSLVAAARVEALIAEQRWDEADALARSLARARRGDSIVARAVLTLANHDRAGGATELEEGRYRLLLSRFPRAPATLEARYRLGLLLYAAGARDSAAELIAEAWRDNSSGTLGPAPRYWSARLRLEEGDTGAIWELQAVARQAPLTFYGVRARELLRDTAFVVDTPLAPPALGSVAPALARGRIRRLAGLGLDSDARAESVGWAADPVASVPVLIAAAQAASEAGFAREAITLGEAARARAGLVPGVVRALFPLPMRGVIEGEAAEHCVDPLLLAALIRQESRFDPRAVSRAGARGLSQVMPATGRHMSERLRLGPWSADLLFVPDFNLHLGARYVFERLEVDSLPLHALLASYNAGPARVRRWRAWPDFADPDLFAERVSIAQTRDYVRTVYASYAWYRAAYSSSSR